MKRKEDDPITAGLTFGNNLPMKLDLFQTVTIHNLLTRIVFKCDISSIVQNNKSFSHFMTRSCHAEVQLLKYTKRIFDEL